MTGTAARRFGLLLALSLLLVTLPVWAQPEPAQDEALQQRLRAHIEFLASDLLRGRQPGTPGYEVAAAYVASQFTQSGLQPAGERGGWFQQVPLRRAVLEPGSARLVLSRDGQSTELTFVEQFYTGPDLARRHSEVRAPAVFAGYGIHAPELGYSDYDGLDVAGKVVVILAGQPAGFPSEEGAHFASYREKDHAAAERGAVGLLRVHTPRRDRRVAWSRYAEVVGQPAMGWLDGSGEPFAVSPELQVNAIVHHAAASVLFEGATHNLEELVALDEAGGPLPVFQLAGEIEAVRASQHEALTSPNVAGVLHGSDPLLSGEYLVYVAHLDHIGERINATDGEDAINNGALDNASGVSVLLETARRFAEGERPRRSILFLTVTAEEKGLVGSEYFARNPTVPAGSMIGVVNLDMPLLLYDFGDVIAFGAEHSSLREAVGQAAAEYGVELSPDPMPEENIFVRSDHYRFVQQGIPAIFLVTGQKSMDGVTDTAPLFEAFLKTHYHRPSDDVHLPIDYRAAARFTRINARIGDIVANQYRRPTWVEGDFFGRTFSDR